jgi:hypothetical protein
MPTITPYEATLLSYLARHTNVPPAQRRRLMAKLTGEALKVAKELESKQRVGGRVSRAMRTARGLRSWAKTNDRLAFKTAGVGV